ncbi:MAG: MFS transporter [Nocardioidaceae bacterium]
MSRPGAGTPPPHDAVLLAAVLLVALNLRGAIAAVAPVLAQIRADLSLSAAAAGLLTTLPVLCFAAAAPVSAWLAKRTGLEAAVLIGCGVIAMGTVLRVLGGTTLLLVGTLATGVAMTLGNVVVPVVIKRDFPASAGTLTGVYTAALAAGAALAAALTAPVAAVWGWRAGLACWSLLAVVAAAVWHVAMRARGEVNGAGARRPGAAEPENLPQEQAGPRLRRSPVAWAVALFLGCQSVAYYSATAWLPTMLADTAGLDLSAAGAAMSLFQLLGIGGTLLIPLLAGRRSRQGWLGVSVACGWMVLLAGLLLWPSAWLAWVLIGGVAQGAGISFAFTVLVLRSHDATATRALSAMTQLVAYTLGAAGPVVVGALYEVTGGWRVPLLTLLTVVVSMVLLALVAGRDVTVGGPVGRASGTG